MYCPDCENTFKCGCKSCVERDPNTVRSKVVGDYSEACGYCGFTMNLDQWLEEEMRQHDESRHGKTQLENSCE